MLVLGIETSCDETAAAVIRSDGAVLSSHVLSQLKEHKAFGGLSPEISARAHAAHLDTLIKAAMEDAGLGSSPDGFKQLSGIAATSGPGLIGGVMVGMIAGKAIAAAHNLPFIAVNHLEGHALSPRLGNNIPFPYLLLLISGGHTQILIAEKLGSYRQLGTTLDDAAGECFDKSAKMMGLGYPGGPELEKQAQKCVDPRAAMLKFPLPAPLKGRAGCDFSFSGLKTAVRQHIEALKTANTLETHIPDLCYALQSKISDILYDRCQNAITTYKQDYKTVQPHFVVCGGVAANIKIRENLMKLCEAEQVTFHAPPLWLCGDNAAMIGWVGCEKLSFGLQDPLNFRARPRWPLDPNAAGRHSSLIEK